MFNNQVVTRFENVRELQKKKKKSLYQNVFFKHWLLVVESSQFCKEQINLSSPDQISLFQTYFPTLKCYHNPIPDFKDTLKE